MMNIVPATLTIDYDWFKKNGLLTKKVEKLFKEIEVEAHRGWHALQEKGDIL